MPPVQSAGVVVPQLATLACLLGLARLALAGAPYSGGAAVPLRAPAKAVHSEAFQHQARADGDGPPNPNANRLPLRAAALVLAASTEADIEPVD